MFYGLASGAVEAELDAGALDAVAPPIATPPTFSWTLRH